MTALCLLLGVLSAACYAQNLDTHPVRLDGEGKLLSWVLPQEEAYAHVARLSADFIKAAMVGPIDPANGLPVIFTHSEYHPDTFVGSGWPNNPGSKNAMLADSMMMYYAYSGDAAMLDAVKALLDYHLTPAGTTPANYYWGNVPWSTAAAGNLNYGTDSTSEGVGILEPDKIGELGFHGYLRFYQITGLAKYRDAAIACADALASYVRTGSATQSPWPFRARADTGALAATPEDYCAHVIAPIRLFDELIRLNLGNVAAYQTARTTAWNWLLTYPMVNNNWSNYFEDDPPYSDNIFNFNGLVALQAARYLLERPELDPNWQAHVTGIINWVETIFGGTDAGEPGLQYGARVISEQIIYKYKMASHTSRWAAVCAMLAERTGDAALKEKAFRSLNWCTYMARDTGSVIEGPFEFAANQYNWFTDGHGDYIRHFFLAMAAFPEWAPATESHILGSTSVVKSVTYAPTSISYATFDASSTETLRVAGAIQSITANGAALALQSDLNAEGYTLEGNGALRVRHDAATDIVITFDPSLIPPSVSLSTSGTLLAPANVTLGATASHPNGIAKLEFFEGANKLGEDTTAPYEFVLRNVPVGTFNVSAKATNAADLTATSSGTLTVGSPTAATNIGNPSEGTTTDYITDGSSAYINACRFVAPANQQLTIIRAKVDAVTGKYQCAIYSDAGNAPNTLLRATGELTPATDGWHTFTLTAPLDATSGTAYWLAIWSNDVNAHVHADNGGTVRFAAYPYSTTWPSPVNLSGSGNFTYSIYATGPGTSAFQQWKLNNGLPDTIATDSDDDFDGLELLAEYGLGTDPLTHDPAPFAAAMDSGHLTLTYPKAKAANDVTVIAQVSGDLVDWFDTATDVTQRWQASDGTTLETITARDLTPASVLAPHRFIRLRITQP